MNHPTDRRPTTCATLLTACLAKLAAPLRLGIILSFLATLALAVETPTATPNGGTFTTFQTVTLSCATAGTRIRYTTNGLDPVANSGDYVLPGATIQISEPCTLKTKAFLISGNETDASAVQSATFAITGDVSTSGSHTLVLRADGAVWATGVNTAGQLGDGTTVNRSVLTQVIVLSDVVAVAAGGTHSLALKRDGTVWAWGSNTNLQCGTTGGSTPHQVTGVANAIKIVAGATHSVALTSASGGSVFTWGGGASGQQGIGSTSDRSSPNTAVLTNVIDIASSAGANHTVALLTAGTVKCWGAQTNGQCGGPPSSNVLSPTAVSGVSGIASVGAGSLHSLAVKTNGEVFGWGSGYSSGYYQPVLVSGFTNVKRVVAGDSYTLAVKNDGSVVALGSNSFGELGIGAIASASSPTAVTLPAPVVLAAGGKSSLAIAGTGNVYAWGNNTNGALGFGTVTQKNVPIQLLSEAIPSIVSISAGGNHNLITSAGSPAALLTWGANTYGQLGANNTFPYSDPHLISGITPLYSASHPETAAGTDFCLVVKADGGVTAAGINTYGQLGNPSTVSTSKTFITVKIAGTPLTGIGAVAAGRWHALAISSATATAGQVYAWGYGIFGQMGNGTGPIQQYTPTLINNLTNVAAVAAGQYHSVALKADGTVWAWGYNTAGQIGNTTATDKKVPNQVGLPGTALTTVAGIASGLNHNLAVKSGGTIAAWGENASGQLGDNTTTNRTLPITVPNIGGVIAVAAGYGHSLALKSDGTVWAWGRNTEGQLGHGDNTLYKTPVQVFGLGGVIAIAAGDYHNLALKADGSLATWGSNSAGQLGTGLSTAQLTPIAVPGMNVLHGVPAVTIEQPNPDTFVMGEEFTLQITPNETVGFPITTVSFFNEGQFIGTSDGTEYVPFSATITTDTWGDFRITATAFDLDGTPSFPSNPVLVHILLPISLSATLASVDSVQLSWTPLPGSSMTYRVERRLPDGLPTIVAEGVTATTFLEQAATFNPAYLYRVIGFNGLQKIASSPEVPVTFLDADGDGLPDLWELAWGLNPYNSGDGSAWVIGDGRTLIELYSQGAAPPPGGLAPGQLAPHQQLVLRQRIVDAATMLAWAQELGLPVDPDVTDGNYELTWDVPVGATAEMIQIEREQTYGDWTALGSAIPVTRGRWIIKPRDVAESGVIQRASNGTGRALNEPDNHRLRGAYHSCESVMRLRLHVRTSGLWHDQPAFAELPGEEFFTQADQGTLPNYFLPNPIRYFSKMEWNTKKESSDTTSTTTPTENFTGSHAVTYTSTGTVTVKPTEFKLEGNEVATRESWDSGRTVQVEGGTSISNMHDSLASTNEATVSDVWHLSTLTIGSIWHSKESQTGSADSDWTGPTGSGTKAETSTASHTFDLDADGSDGSFTDITRSKVVTNGVDGPEITIPISGPASAGNAFYLGAVTTEAYQPDFLQIYYQSKDWAEGATDKTIILSLGDQTLDGTYTTSNGDSSAYFFEKTKGHIHLSIEYTSTQFDLDSRALLPSLPGDPGSHSGLIPLSGGEVYSSFRTYPERVDASASMPSQVLVSEHRFSNTLGTIHLAHSEYQLECNDCAPGAAITVVEYEHQYAMDNGTEINDPQISGSLAIQPGSKPGSSIKTAWRSSALPAVIGAGTNISRSLEFGTLDMLRVDTDRNGIITDDDSFAKDAFNFERGAIYTVNFDADDATRYKNGYPLPDAIAFDAKTGEPTEEDFIIQNADDEKDIAPLIIRYTEWLPPSYRVLLKVEEEEDFHAIHIFKRIKAQETAIWGGATSGADWKEGVDITIWANPNASGYVDTRENGAGDYLFGVEGLLLRGMKVKGDIGTLDKLTGNPELAGLFSGEIVVKIQIITPDGGLAGEDCVRLHVAPWLMLPNDRHAETFYTVNTTNPPATAEFAVPFDQTVAHTDIATNQAGTRWLQDHVEIGYTQRPGGPKTWLAFRLPYKNVLSDWSGAPGSAEMPKWVLSTLLKKDIGVFTLGTANSGVLANPNTGGNLELLPPNETHPLGRIAQGSSVGKKLRDFLIAQQMQPRANEVTSGWLSIGHIDEVCAFLGPNHIAVANPALAYQLLEDTSQIPVADRARAVFFAKGTKLPVLGTIAAVNEATGTLLVHATIPPNQYIWNYLRVYAGAGAGQVLKIHVDFPADTNGNYSVEVQGIYKTGTTILPDGSGAPCLRQCLESGYSAGTMPGVDASVVLVEDSLWRSANQTATGNTPMLFTAKEVLDDINFRTLNLGGIKPLLQSIRDSLAASNGETVSFVELPVLFINKDQAEGEPVTNPTNCKALTGNLVNLQASDGQYFLPKPYAPLIGVGVDLFEVDVRQKLTATFFRTWHSYHIANGEIHCGTNVRRSIPDEWWRKIPPTTSP
jgi:alpha-tubulin suppressor-like RCC1 family protein